MTDFSFAIRPFDFRHAGEAAHAAYNNYHNTIRAEQLPDDAPRSLRRAISEWHEGAAHMSCPLPGKKFRVALML